MKNSVMKDIETNGDTVTIGCKKACMLVLINDINTQQTPIWTININDSVMRPPRVPNVTLVTSINDETRAAGGCVCGL